MVSALDSGTTAPGGSPGLGHCVVFLGKTLYFRKNRERRVYKWVPANFPAGGNSAIY